MQNKLYGLIGFPLSHSFSKKYFTEKFEKEKILGCEFNLFPIEKIEMFPELINENHTLLGLSVTIPYKESVIPFLDELDETAKAVGAVNCVRISRKESSIHLKGFNTDVFGFRQSIKPFLESQHERALILGTGGASKAVFHVLKEIGIECYFASRQKKQNASDKTFLYEELNENMMNAFKLIVNTSPLGMFPHTESAPQIPYDFISSSHLLYDLVYNPTETEFLKRGKAKGASTVNGLSMLYQQAEEAWRIWNK
ncbi:MAG: shikimate dehydrogenase [Bacteroidetes bacterium]|nr:shikimate dehydrogenase [Bacteroidota bacterium]